MIDTLHILLHSLKTFAFAPVSFGRWWHRLAGIVSQFSDARPKIIYGITPPPRLRNIGDQAQAVAILEWMAETFPEHAIIELDKDETIHLALFLKPFIRSSDIIVLHSGGNMGDRGMWSERGRRKLIQLFPHNKIVSLPQTIYFADTEKGRRELQTSKYIYNSHPNLAIVARDQQSHLLAKDYFPSCDVTLTPDFVLRYQYSPADKNHNGKVLFCLRNDNESVLGSSERDALSALAGRDFDIFDTTIEHDIERASRKEKLEETLRYFGQYEMIITDRYHGIIFSVLNLKPTVVLPTVDHKLTAAMKWFENVQFVKLASTIEDVPECIEQLARVDAFRVPDWDAEYFSSLVSYF